MRLERKLRFESIRADREEAAGQAAEFEVARLHAELARRPPAES